MPSTRTRFTTMILDLLCALLIARAQPGDRPTEPDRYFVATSGNDAWSGRLPAPNADRSDGPFATPRRARDAIRALKHAAGGALSAPVVVAIRAGRYQLAEPLVLGPEDSGSKQFPITYTAYEHETPVLSGGRAIGGWAEGSLAGRPCWIADVPTVRDGKWLFHQLWVGGERRPRARHPNVDQDFLGVE